MSPTLLHIDPIQRYLRGVVLCSVPERDHTIALTFDDGPNPRNTPALLDLLDRKKVPATFFVLGKRLNRFGEISRRAHDAGHEIESHGYWHLPLPLMPNSMLRREIRRTGEAIEKWTGRRPRFFRPPMGWFSHRCLRVLEDEGYQAVIGNIHPEDSRRPDPEVVLDRIRQRIAPGSIIILHDGGWRATVDRSPTIEAVDRLTDELGGAGYRFVTLEELVGLPGGASPVR
ncbi:polysaccharide deacetylase family protein [bacterium]|nr:MAG: polysaccharide deacetylase family protein [bacterium]